MGERLVYAQQVSLTHGRKAGLCAEGSLTMGNRPVYAQRSLSPKDNLPGIPPWLYLLVTLLGIPPWLYLLITLPGIPPWLYLLVYTLVNPSWYTSLVYTGLTSLVYLSVYIPTLGI